MQHICGCKIYMAHKPTEPLASFGLLCKISRIKNTMGDVRDISHEYGKHKMLIAILTHKTLHKCTITEANIYK